MSDEIKNSPHIRFKGFTEKLELCTWADTVDISTEMVDPKCGDYDNLPHVAPGNIESFTGQLYDNIKKVKEENLISGKFRFRDGDIIYGKINPQLGKYVFAQFDGLTSADAYVLNAKGNLNQKYLFSILQTSNFFNYSVSVSKRSGIPKVNRNELNAYNFFVPSFDEQDKIGNLFLNIDKIITVQQRKLELLKATKKSMLKKMFPQDGEDVPEIRFVGFTDEWEQRNLSDVAEYRNGKAHEKDIDENGIYVVVNSKFVSSNGQIKKFSNKLIEPLKSGEIAFVLSDVPNGKALARTFLIDIDDKYSLNQRIAGITPQKETDSYFLNILMNRNNYFLKYDNGVGQTNLSKSEVESFLEFYPCYEEQVKIGGYFRELDNLIALHQNELELFKCFKKSMLQQMFI